MKYIKKVQSVSEQIDKLKHNGILVDDVKILSKILYNVSYYRLRAYLYYFEELTTPSKMLKNDLRRLNGKPIEKIREYFNSISYEDKEAICNYIKQIDPSSYSHIIDTAQNGKLKPVFSGGCFEHWTAFLSKAEISKSSRNKYKDGTSFSDVYDLYLFDKRIMSTILSYINDFEISFRARISNLSVECKDSHYYVNANNFIKFDKFITDSSKYLELCKGSKEEFARHYMEIYTTPSVLPIWALVEIMPFGDLIYLFNNLNNQFQEMISKSYSINKIQFLGFINQLREIRNSCAHFNRTWNKTFAKVHVLDKYKRKSKYIFDVEFMSLVNYINDPQNSRDSIYESHKEKINQTVKCVSKIEFDSIKLYLSTESIGTKNDLFSSYENFTIKCGDDENVKFLINLARRKHFQKYILNQVSKLYSHFAYTYLILCSIDDRRANNFKNEIEQLCNMNMAVSNYIKDMGFPRNWQARLFK